VFVVPDGSLNLVNLYALPVGTTGYVIESGPIIHYLSAERDLAWSDGGKESGSGLLALGGAAFDSRVEPSPYDSSAVARRAESGGPAAEGSAYRGAPPDCVNFRSAHFEPLPESVKEVADIAAAWSGPGNARVLTGASATEHAFKLLAPGRRVLHLATHGFFLNGNCEASSLPEAMRSRGIGGLSAGGAGPAARPGSASAGRVDEDNPLLLSGVALAGANRRDSARPDEEDGILTAEEIASLDLSRVEWAVLSACDTGVGEIQVGEGVLGLRRAFEAAGVSTLIMSLWPVEDRSAREWMKILYQAKFRKKLETDEAVREASLGVLRARRAQRAGSHPFYWAAFVAAGDWR
jgi:CHAT domain-containing protein